MKRNEIIDELFKICSTPSTSELIKFDNFLKIWELLEKLIDLEKDIKDCQQNRTDDGFNKFFNYLNENNCDTKKFDIKKTDIGVDGEFCLKAKKNFQKGDLIFSIPKSIILTTNEINNSPLRQFIINDKLLSVMPNVALSIYLLYERLNKSSKWNDYLNILPDTFNNVLYFNLNEIKMLQTSQSFNNILIHFRNIIRQYTYIYKLLESNKDENLLELKKNFSFKNYRWSVSIVTTRQNNILDENNNKIYALIPVLDMCNHEEGEICTDYDINKNCANCYAIKNINIDDEITIFYGQRNNRDFLIHNGFVMEHNTFDSTYLRLSINQNDTLFNEKLSVLMNFGMKNHETFELKWNEKKIIPSETFVFTRIFLIKTEKELKEIKYTLNDDQIIRSFQTTEVKQYLKIRLMILIEAYKKLNLEKNENLNKNSRTNYIMKLLLCEMRILEQAQMSLDS